MSPPDLGSASDWSCCMGICFNQSEALPRSGPQYGISVLLSQTSFYRKPEVASQNVGCFLRLHCSHFHKNPDLCQMEHVPHTWTWTLQSKFPDYFGKWLSVEQEGQKFRLVWKDHKISLKYAPQHIARDVVTFLLYHFHWLCKSIL